MASKLNHNRLNRTIQAQTSIQQEQQDIYIISRLAKQQQARTFRKTNRRPSRPRPSTWDLQPSKGIGGPVKSLTITEIEALYPGVAISKKAA